MIYMINMFASFLATLGDSWRLNSRKKADFLPTNAIKRCVTPYRAWCGTLAISCATQLVEDDYSNQTMAEARHQRLALVWTIGMRNWHKRLDDVSN